MRVVLAGIGDHSRHRLPESNATGPQPRYRNELVRAGWCNMCRLPSVETRA